MTDIKHKPGCDALGGYGNGVGPCTCGPTPPAVMPAAPSEGEQSEAAQCDAWWSSLTADEKSQSPATIAWCAWKQRAALSQTVQPQAEPIDNIKFVEIAARHLPGDMDPHNAWLFFQEAARTFLGKEVA